MALVLTRRVGEIICIGDNITVTVIEINGHQVRMAIEAPRDIAVDRQEIRDRKEAGWKPN